MKLLFDENLSPLLPQALASLYPDSAHVHSCGLASSDDAAIWHFAKANGFTIVSKDSDFAERSVLLGAPPKIVWLRAPNCSTRDIENLLRAAAPLVAKFIERDEETCLILGI